jgi:hypothetical protein
MTDEQKNNRALAFMLSLGIAILESVRTDVSPTTALGNRLGRAVSMGERAIDCIPGGNNDVRTMALASDLFPVVAQRIYSFLENDGFLRGEEDWDRFKFNALESLNDPKNVVKGEYREMSWVEIRDKLKEEYQEVEAEMWNLSPGGEDKFAAIREFVLSVVAMIGAVKAENL